MSNKKYMEFKIISFVNFAKKRFKDADFNYYLESVVIGNIKYINSDYKGSDDICCLK
jgi:hypothetical protein